MILRPPISTRTDTLVPDPTLFRCHRSALPAWRCGRGAEVVGESTELQRLDPVDHGRELRQVVRRVAAGAIEQGDAGAAFDRRQAPLHHAVQAHALQRAEATGQAQQLARLGEHHDHVPRAALAIRGAFAERSEEQTSELKYIMRTLYA